MAVAWRDKQGELASTDQSFARLEVARDELDRWVETLYFGVGGAPVLRKETGVAKRTSVHDTRGNLVEQAYFGVDGAPILRKDIGAAKQTWVYDARGNAVEEAYFGVDGAPILHADMGRGETDRCIRRARQRDRAGIFSASTARRSYART